jgi:glycosyltransferase involved in cell wall biosynthesis
MEPKRCVLIDQYSTVGGGQTVFLNVIRACLKAGISVTALFPHGGELERRMKAEFGNELKMLDIKELNLTRGRKNLVDFGKTFFFLMYFLKFLPLLKQQDFIYVNGPRLFPAALFCSYFLKRRFIYHLHIEHTEREKRLVVRLAMRPTTHRVIANSQFLYNQLCEFDSRLRDNPRLILIENSLSPRLSALPFCNRFEGNNRFNVVTFGRISYEKGQDLILDMALQFPHWNFFLAGIGEFAFEQDLRKRAPANLTFLGEVADISKAVTEHRLQISVVPSRVPEAFGMVAIESMASSCFTIASNQGELPNLAARTLVPVFESTGSLQSLLQGLQTRPVEETEQIAQQQFSKTKEQFSFEPFAEKIQAVFNQ